MGFRLLKQIAQAASVGKFNLFFAEIQFQFQKGCEFQESVPDLLQLSGIAAAKLIQGNAVLSLGFGRDDI